jgi:uncharacterized membrane protein
MNGQGPQEFFGYDLGVNSEVLGIIALLLVVVGLFLAFAGRKAWRHVMSFIGAVVGGLMGFAIGTAIGGWAVGLMVSVLAAMVGSALFVFVANVAIGLTAGLLAFIVAGALTGSTLVGLAVGLVAFIVTIAFIETAIGVVTAVVGGLLVGIGVMWFGLEMLVVVMAMLGSMVLGGAFQMFALREESELRERARRVGSESSVAMGAVAAPAPPPVPGRACERCGAQMTYIPEYNRYFCQKCGRYD